MRPKYVTYTIAAGAATAVGLGQTAAVAKDLALNGLLVNSAGAAVFPLPRHVAIASASDDEHTTNFTVKGTDRNGASISETLAGPGAGLTVQTTKNFKTVTGVSVDAALSGNVTIGTGDSLETNWIPVERKTPTFVALTKGAGADMTAAIQSTMGNVFHIPEGDLPIDGAIDDDVSGAVGLKGCTAVRLKITSHVAGDVSLNILSGY